MAACLILGVEPPCLPACISHKCPILINQLDMIEVTSICTYFFSPETSEIKFLFPWGMWHEISREMNTISALRGMPLGRSAFPRKTLVFQRQLKFPILRELYYLPHEFSNMRENSLYSSPEQRICLAFWNERV